MSLVSHTYQDVILGCIQPVGQVPGDYTAAQATYSVQGHSCWQRQRFTG